MISNGKQSSFVAEQKINNAQDPGQALMDELLASETKPLYKDFNKKEFYKEFNMFSKHYLVQDTIPTYNWTLTKEQTKIMGFDAVKAIAKDEYGNDLIAWFTKSINIKDGPYHFANLPGLILRVEMDNEIFKTVFEITAIDLSEQEIKIELPKKAKVVTNDEFLQEMRELNQRYDEINQSVEKN